jgi:hypothetical protein
MAGDPPREGEGVTMRAIQIIEWGTAAGGARVSDPEPQGKLLLLRVEAAGI